ncbi:MAG TPA: phosphotransferase [Ktedonobacteraceae bacterium]|nr:phosphotransferase [Ktedonobacteraceae bacterium]
MQEDGLEETPQDLLDLTEVMHAFGVSEWNNLGPVASAHDGSSGLLVEIAGQRYILKEPPGGLLEEDSSHRYAFQRYLRESGIPVPSLWLTPQGEPALTIGEDVFELWQWIDGEVYDSKHPRSLQWVAAAGEMLARIHQASRRYPGSEHRWPSEVQAGGLVQGWLNFARAIADQSEVHAIAAALSNVIDQWEAVLPVAMMSIGSGRGLPEFNIHGDYTPMHLRFEGEAVCAVSGWDASRWEKRLIELAYTLFSFSALEWRTDSPLTRPLMKRGFDPVRMRRFLAAYGALYPPVPGEAALLADALMLVTPIITANGPLEDIFYAEENIEEILIDDVLERLAWATSLPAWLGRMRSAIAEMWECLE